MITFRSRPPDDPTREKQRSRNMKIAFLCGIGILFIAALLALRTVLTPVIISLVLAYVADPLLGWFERHRVRRWIATILLYIICLALVWIAVASLGPKFVNQTQKLYRYVSGVAFSYGSILEDPAPAGVPVAPEGGTNVVAAAASAAAPETSGSTNRATAATSSGLVDRISGFFEAMTASEISWRERARTYLRTNADEIASRVAALSVTLFQNAMKGLSSAASFMLGLLLILIFTFFFMLHFRTMISTVRRYIPAASRERTLRIIGRIDAAVSNFFRGRLLVCLVAGVVYVIGFRISNIDYWLLLGLAGGILGFIPILGVVLPMIPAAAFALLTPTPWMSLVGVLVTFSLVQWIVEPLAGTLIMSRQVKMHPVSVLLALLIGGYLFGVFGIILSIPLAAVVKILSEEFVLPPLRDLADGTQDADDA